MKYCLLYFLVCFNFVSSDSEKQPNNPPYFMHLEVDLNQPLKLDSAFTIIGQDSTIRHTVELLSDSSAIPLVYYTDLLTPVCIDDICKPLYLELYWDLVGNYAGFGVYPNEKLSKFDHDLFTAEDYTKLDQLLRNQFSALERKELSELYTNVKREGKAVKYNGKEVDGITGATVQEIKDEVVEGALYSCYTLWHLCYGEARSKIKQHIEQIADHALLQELLMSGHEAYWIFAISQLTREELVENAPQIAAVLSHCSPLNRGKILKRLPEEIFKQASFSELVYAKINEYDRNSITLILRNLSTEDWVSQMRVVKHLSVLTKNQLQLFLKHCSLENKDLLSSLNDFANNSKNPYGYIVKSFLADQE